jgi:hypothetical protein
VSGRGYIAAEEDRRCELCGKVAETRPYGPNGERICYACGMKDVKTTNRKLAQHIFGEYEA